MHDPDMTAAAVSRRLHVLARLSLEILRPRPCDMSPRAVERRLRELASLERACRELAEAGRRAGLHAGRR